MTTSYSIASRVKIAAIALSLIVVIQCGVFFYKNNIMLENAQHLANIDLPKLALLKEARLAITDIQIWFQSISAARGENGFDKGFDDASTHADIFRKRIQTLQNKDPSQRNEYTQILNAFEKFYASGKNMAQVYIESGLSEGTPLLTQFKSDATQLHAALKPIRDALEQHLLADAEKQTELATSARYFIIGSGLLTLCVALAAFGMIYNNIVTLPQLIASTLKRDTNKTLSSAGPEEIKKITDILMGSRVDMQDMINHVKSTTQSLSSASAQLVQGSRQSQDSIVQQQSQAEMIATAVNEMTASIQDVSSNITGTATAASEANEETNEGQQVVASAIGKIEQLAEQIEDTASIVNNLEKDTTSITSILDVIRGVAEQTNLLALNAAIEAARAGEQGRGFAVVADEVRTLASRTQDSTEEINTMIDKLLSGSQRAVEEMHKSQAQASAVVDQATQAGQSLSSISNAVSKINEMSAQIATAAEEQSAVAEEINRNIIDMNNKFSETTDTIAQTTQSSEQLANTSRDLNTIVEQLQA